MSAVESDFDRLASLDADGWTANNHYHNLLLRHVPQPCEHALEVGCGTGAFSRLLAQRAQHVTAIDLSSQMIRVASSRSPEFPNIDYEVDDIVTRALPELQFDCITSIATLHHVPTRAVLEKIKGTLKTGGSLIVLDLLEPERKLLTAKGLTDSILNAAAMGASCSLRLLHNGRLRPPREVRAAWEEHGKTDRYLTLDGARSLYGSLFPGVMVRKHLLWRYSAIWTKR